MSTEYFTLNERKIHVMDNKVIKMGISLYAIQKQQLDELCQSMGIHQSELIRLLIRQEYERRVKGPRHDA